MKNTETLQRTARIQRCLEEACRERLRAFVQAEIPSEDGGLVLGKGMGWFLDLDSVGRNPWLDLDAREMDPLREFLKPGTALEVSFTSSSLDGYFRFPSEVMLWAENGKTLRLRLPHIIERMQRRVTLRVRPTPEKPVTAVMEGSGGAFEAEIESLSVRGAGFRVPRHRSPRAGEILKSFRLRLPEGELTRTAKVIEVSLQHGQDARVAVHFLDVDSHKEDLIRNYMRSLLETASKTAAPHAGAPNQS
jgi:hypothetical protein